LLLFVVDISHFFLLKKGENVHFIEKWLDHMVLMTLFLVITATDFGLSLPNKVMRAAIENGKC